jgi:hypothetical protein
LKSRRYGQETGIQRRESLALIGYAPIGMPGSQGNRRIMMRTSAIAVFNFD